MNKWTVLSVVVLIGVLGACMWMITQNSDPLLETESAAEQEIGVEEFEADDNPMGDVVDSETVLEPDMTMDDAGDDESTSEPAPGQPLDAGDADGEGNAGEDPKNAHENP